MKKKTKKVKSPKMIKQGKTNRRKGGDYERKVAQEYRDAGFDCVRGRQERDGFGNPDLILASRCGRDDSRVPLWIECTNSMTLQVKKKLDQADEAMRSHNRTLETNYQNVVVHHHMVGGRDIVIMDLGTWLEVLGNADLSLPRNSRRTPKRVLL